MARERRLSASKSESFDAELTAHFHPPHPAEGIWRLSHPLGRNTHTQGAVAKELTRIIRSLSRAVKEDAKLRRKGLPKAAMKITTTDEHSFY